jgi:hypothetical protein
MGKNPSVAAEPVCVTTLAKKGSKRLAHRHARQAKEPLLPASRAGVKLSAPDISLTASLCFFCGCMHVQRMACQQSRAGNGQGGSMKGTGTLREKQWLPSLSHTSHLKHACSLAEPTPAYDCTWTETPSGRQLHRLHACPQPTQYHPSHGLKQLVRANDKPRSKASATQSSGAIMPLLHATDKP